MTSENGGGESGPGGASELLNRLFLSHDLASFASAWLQLQSKEIGDELGCSVIVFGEPDSGPFAPVAIWPEGVVGSPLLVKCVQAAIATSQSVRESGSEKLVDVIALPVLVDESICGAVAVEISHVSEERSAEIERALQLGLGWLEAFARRRHSTAPDRLVTVLDLVATGLHHDRFQMAATAVATDMARVLGCERVCIGFTGGQHSRVMAVSNSAAFEGKSNVVRAIEAAMDEAIDQQASIVYPVKDKKSITLVRAHKILEEEHKVGCLCTVPMTIDSKIVGAIVFERQSDQAFDEGAVELCEHMARLLGPLLEVKRREDRWLVTKAWDDLKGLAKKLVGPRHTALKLSTGSTLVVLLLLIFVHGDFRVSGDAKLEGKIQRAVSAPLSGYISDANFRAGDTVSQGDVLFSLDDRELWLERLRAGSEQAQYTHEYSEAVARRDRAESRVLSARIKQADAQIELIDQQLARIQVKAPFDAVIVSGDLSQSLGAPVERGDVLFQLAPLDTYRVILQINERDINDVRTQQKGVLILSSVPDSELNFQVTKITPVAIAEAGNNFFVVEAELTEAPPAVLRPGMEGVGKVEIESRRLIWIWTYKITHWVRMAIWSWWP